MPPHKTRPTLYIAGPMTGIPEFNHPLFHKVSKRLRNRGFDVVNPALLNPDLDYELLIELGLKDLTQRADAVALLPGWRDSRGTLGEVARAKELGMQIRRWRTWVFIGPSGLDRYRRGEVERG